MSFASALTVAGLLVGFLLLASVRTPRGRSDGASVSVIIPARNEEASLPRLLRSLSEQSVSVEEVIVVDDGSTDRTAEVAISAGAVLLRAPVPPDGWVGKPWACHVGARHANGETLVFLDADVVMASDGLDQIVASWQRDALDGLLPVQPFHSTHAAYEQLSAYPNLLSVMASGVFAPRWWRRPPVAFGPCIVTSAAAYRRVGGHASVADEVIEDIHLAQCYGAHGLPVQVLAGGPVLSFRMYPSGLRQLIEGWTKNLAGGPRLVGRVPLMASVAWLLASIAVATDLFRALAAGAVTGDLSWVPIAAWAVVAVQTSWMLRCVGAYRWWAGPAYPILLAAFVALFLRSAIHRLVRRTVTWRGRSVGVRAK